MFSRASRRLAALALALCATGASAQAWPARPVRMIAALPPGSAPDVIARVIGDKLSAIWKQPVVIDNKPGAGGILAMSNLVRSAPDGYTLSLAVASTITLTPHLYKQPQFDVDRDLTPVAVVGTSPMMIAVGTSSGIGSLSDLIGKAKAQPGKINFATPAPNTTPHLTGDMLNAAAGIQLYTVPYSGSVGAVTATVSGEAAVTIDGLPALVPFVKSGRLKPIAVTSQQRLPGYEAVPTVAESFPGFESIGWFAIIGPAGLPPDVVERINRDVNAVVQQPDVIARLADLGVYPKPGSPKAAADFIRDQRAQWHKVVQRVGLQPQ